MFVEEYLKDLRRAGFTPRAVAAYAARCASRSRAASARRPRAVRGILVGAGANLLIAAAVSLLVGRYLDPMTGVIAFSGAATWLAAGSLWMGLHLDMLEPEESLPPTGIGLPNMLTLGRLVAIPVFNALVVGGFLVPALVALLIGGLTDVVDGMVARATGATTRLGRVFDPIVDVLFNIGIAVGLTRAGLLPAWLLAIILLRYGLLLFGAAYIYVFRGPVRVRPTPLGKATGVLNTMVLFAVGAVVYFAAPATADSVLRILYTVLAIVFSLTIVQVVVIGLYNIRHLGGRGPSGPLSLLVGRDREPPR